MSKKKKMIIVCLTKDNSILGCTLNIMNNEVLIKGQFSPHK